MGASRVGVAPCCRRPPVQLRRQQRLEGLLPLYGNDRQRGEGGSCWQGGGPTQLLVVVGGAWLRGWLMLRINQPDSSIWAPLRIQVQFRVVPQLINHILSNGWSSCLLVWSQSGGRKACVLAALPSLQPSMGSRQHCKPHLQMRLDSRARQLRELAEDWRWASLQRTADILQMPQHRCQSALRARVVASSQRSNRSQKSAKTRWRRRLRRCTESMQTTRPERDPPAPAGTPGAAIWTAFRIAANILALHRCVRSVHSWSALQFPDWRLHP